MQVNRPAMLQVSIHMTSRFNILDRVKYVYFWWRRKIFTTEIPEFLWVIVVDLFVSKPHSCDKKSNKL